MSHDADKLIRQLSLVAFLMAEPRALTARDIKQCVEGYSEMSDEAFARRFYSDRTELLALGVPLQSQRDEFTGEELYTLRSEQYFLPPLELKDDEWAALQTALFRLEGAFAYAEPLRLALQNLALGRGNPADVRREAAVHVEFEDPDYSPETAGRLTKLEAAISKQRTVKFDYRSMSRDEVAVRTLNPYALFRDAGGWYVVGWDLGADAERTFKVSRVRGEITFATRRERDFRAPKDFEASRFRGRPAWQVGELAGDAHIRLAPDTAWWVERSFAGRGQVEDAVFTTPYAGLGYLASWVLGRAGRATPLDPPELVAEVEEGLRRVVAAHEGPPPVVAPPVEREPEASQPERTAGPVPPERFAVLQALLAHLLARCGDERRAVFPSRELVEGFGIPLEQLDEHLQLLNLVNFGGGCYAVYAVLDGDEVRVEKELFGETFRRPPRLTPLEARAIRLALEFVGPLVKPPGGRTPLDRVRAKLEDTFGQFQLADAPPALPDDEEELIRTLQDAIAKRRVVEFEYLRPDQEQATVRVVEPVSFERTLPSWYVHVWDRERDAKRTFKIDRMRNARMLDETFEPRELSDAGQPTTRVWFAPELARWELEKRPDAVELVDGAALAELRFSSEDWLVGEVVSQRGYAVVLEPEDLRGRVAERARELLGSLAAASAGPR